MSKEPDYRLWYEKFPYNLLTWVLMGIVWAFLGLAKFSAWIKRQVGGDERD